MAAIRRLGAAAGLALGFALAAAPRAASADCGGDGYRYAPRYVGSFKSYGWPSDLADPVTQAKAASAKTARVCKDCAEPLRGVRITSKEEAGGGFLQVPTPIGDGVCVQAVVDVSRMLGTDAFAGVELDSPFVALPAVPLSGYLFVGVQNLEGVPTVWVELNGGDAGTPLALAPETQSVLIEIHYAGGSVDVSARAMQDEALSPVLAGGSLPYAGSTGLGTGAYVLDKGGKVGVSLAVQGDVHDAALQAVIDALRGVVALEDGALANLATSAPADARTKLEQARAATDPALLGAVAALPASKAQAQALAQLTGAAAKLAAARDAIDANTPETLAKAPGLAEKARAGHLAVQRMLETGVVAEGKP